MIRFHSSIWTSVRRLSKSKSVITVLDINGRVPVIIMDLL